MTLNEMLNFEHEYQRALNRIKDNTVNMIRHTVIPNTHQLNAHMCLVTISALRGQPWDPAYYLSERQADAVEAVFRNCSSVTALRKAIAEMCKTGYDSKKQNRVRLNDTTLSILRSVMEE